MKLKRILAAIAACAMSAAMLGMTVSAAGIDADEDVIEDVDTDEDIDLDEDEDVDLDEDEDEDIAPVETEATTAAPVTATNPTTGNAPIALAVIPVALAAAAVVAKKAK